MRSLLIYEWKKFRYNKKNGLIFVLILISFVGYVFSNFYMNNKYQKDMISNFYDYRQKALYDIENMSNYQSLVEDIFEQNYYSKAERYFRNLYDCANTLYKEYSDSTIKVDDLIHWNEILIKGKKENINVNVYTNDTLNKLKAKRKELKFLKKYNISVKESPYVCTSSNLIINISRFNLGFLLLVFFYLLIINVYDEFDSGVYKILYSSKHKKSKILLSKCAFSSLLLLMYIFLLVFLFMINGLIFGFGDLNYPYSIGNVIYSERIIIIKILFYIVLMCLFLICVYSLFTCFVKSIGNALSILLTVYLMIDLFASNFRFIDVFMGFINPNFDKMLQINNDFYVFLMDLIFMIICAYLNLKYLDKKDMIG